MTKYRHSAIYSIGDVATKSGLTVHTIRKWEDRYNAVSPERSDGGTRRYREEQVQRLTLLKHLVGAGHSISAIAQLSTHALGDLRQPGGSVSAGAGVQTIRVGVVGPSLATILMQNRYALSSLQIVPNAATEPHFEPDSVDLVILETPILSEGVDDEIRRLRQYATSQKVIVAYDYGALGLANRLANYETACLRTPINLENLERTIQSLLVDDKDNLTSSEPSPPKYSKRVLARVAALQASNACECPRHVAELLSALTSFEAYSAQCESKNPRDAQMHAYLAVQAGYARNLLEAAMTNIATHEEIPLTQWQQSDDAT